MAVFGGGLLLLLALLMWFSVIIPGYVRAFRVYSAKRRLLRARMYLSEKRALVNEAARAEKEAATAELARVGESEQSAVDVHELAEPISREAAEVVLSERRSRAKTKLRTREEMLAQRVLEKERILHAQQKREAAQLQAELQLARLQEAEAKYEAKSAERRARQQRRARILNSARIMQLRRLLFAGALLSAAACIFGLGTVFAGQGAELLVLGLGAFAVCATALIACAPRNRLSEQSTQDEMRTPATARPAQQNAKQNAHAAAPRRKHASTQPQTTTRRIVPRTREAHAQAQREAAARIATAKSFARLQEEGRRLKARAEQNRGIQTNTSRPTRPTTAHPAKPSAQKPLAQILPMRDQHLFEEIEELQQNPQHATVNLDEALRNRRASR